MGQAPQGDHRVALGGGRGRRTDPKRRPLPLPVPSALGSPSPGRRGAGSPGTSWREEPHESASDTSAGAVSPPPQGLQVTAKTPRAHPTCDGRVTFFPRRGQIKGSPREKLRAEPRRNAAREAPLVLSGPPSSCSPLRSCARLDQAGRGLTPAQVGLSLRRRCGSPVRADCPRG